MNAQTTTTGAPRMGHQAKAMSNARAFLAKVQEDDVLAAKMADADGYMPAILALAAGASLPCTARDLLNAYEDLQRAEAAGPGPGAPADISHPMVYIPLVASADISHPCVYIPLVASADTSPAREHMTLESPSGFGYPVVYLPRGSA